jgi:phage baseplate assembly protein gpV
MLTKLRNMIRQAVVNLVFDSDDSYPTMQVVSNGKTMKVTKLSTYGVYAKPEIGSHVLLFNSQAQESVQFGIVNDMFNGPENMKEGEVALVNPVSGATILMRADGKVVINGIVFDDHIHGAVTPGTGVSGGPQ